MRATRNSQNRAGGYQIPGRTTWPEFGSQVNHQGRGKQVAGYLQDGTPLISYVVLKIGEKTIPVGWHKIESYYLGISSNGISSHGRDFCLGDPICGQKEGTGVRS